MKTTEIELKAELKRYKKAYKILIEYFDSIDENEQKKVSKKLTKINL